MLSTLHGAAAKKSLNVCFIVVALMVEQPQGYPYIARALKFGLPRVIVMYAASADTNEGNTNQKMARILEHLLRAALVSYRVVWQLREVFQDAVDLAIELYLNKTQFAEQWSGFSASAQDRIGVLNSWEAKSRPSYKVCSNLKVGSVVWSALPAHLPQCHVTGPRTKFKCCSICTRADYCSTKCQSVDWRDGHRSMCESLRLAKLRKYCVSRRPFGYVSQEFPEKNFTTREKNFLPAILTHDFLRSMKTICFRQIEFIHENPKKPNFLVFVYQESGETNVNVYPEENASDEDEKSLHLRTGLPQVARSGRRLEMHAVMLYQGQASRRVVVTMHITSSKLVGGLNNIVWMIPRGWTASEAWDVIEGPIDRLIQEVRRDVVLFHQRLQFRSKYFFLGHSDL
jgi:hypothetical protein